MNRTSPLLVATILLLAAFAAKAGDPADLDDLLARLAGNAARYRDQTLSLTCDERIRWVGGVDAGQARFGHVYVFDDDEGFEEYRTRYRQNPKRKARRVRPEEFGIPVYVNNAYLWCFTFRAERQRHHTYSIVGTEDVHGIEAVMIRFEPVPPLVRRVNDWYGTAWVDPATAQPLKVEAFSPDDWAKLEGMRGGARFASVSFEVQRITTFFDERLDGLRVPSRVELRDEQYILEEPEDWLAGEGWDYRKVTHLEVDQAYSKYRLFGVRSSERIGTAGESR